MIKLEARNIACKKGDNFLFSKLSFLAHEGELVAIRGHNGAGKSSLLKILTGLASPERGIVFWQDQNIAQSDIYYEHISYLGHKDGLRLALTPYENIVYGLTLAGCTYSEKKLLEIATFFALKKVLHFPSYHLSAGQRRKVALTIILLQQKKVWFLDEPFASLDEESLQQLTIFFRGHLEQRGLIVMTCHGDYAQAHQLIELGSSMHSSKGEHRLC